MASSTPPSPTVVFDNDSLAQLNAADAKALLDTIDSLRELEVGTIVDLPQIIVIGDQSSGKSSVLEAISHIRFPVDGDLCTRFATELILRRAPDTAIDVSIQYASNRPPSATRAEFRRSSFDKDALSDIIKEATERMGIRAGSTKRFSKDILRVQLSGPDVYPLTLVDLPGIYHSATADQDLEGKRIVDELLESYMRQPKSIILAVVAANHPLANQLVLQKTQTHDPDRTRTIGVITKPDLAGPGSTNERKYLDLAKGRESMHKLALGWYVLRNPSEAERSAEVDTRDAMEEGFFRTGSWSSIAPANRGIESLRKRLSKVLLDHIRLSLPDLIQDIESNLNVRQEDLERLGQSRSTPEELRSYLFDIAASFERLARDGVEGRYTNKLFGGIEGQEMKLRARLRNQNRAFVLVMKNKGASYKIVPDKDPSKSNSGEGAEEGEGADDEEEEYPEYLRGLVRAYPVPATERKTEAELRDRLQALASVNQGTELPGEANGGLARQLFKEQAVRWESIAWMHLERTMKLSKDFVDGTVLHIVGADTSTSTALLRAYVDTFFREKEDILRAKLEELLYPYAGDCSLPLEDEFRESMHKRTIRRLGQRIAERLEQNYPDIFNYRGGHLEQWHVREVVGSLEKAEGDSFGTAKVIEMMLSFYEISLRTFVDNIINLAAESCLVTHIPSILTGKMVHKMTDQTLEELAAESDEVRDKRELLQNQVKILKEGLSKCQRHAPRSLPRFLTATPRKPLGSGSQQMLAATSSTSRSPTPTGPPAAQPANTSPQEATRKPLFPAEVLFDPGPTPRFPLSPSQPPAGPSLFGTANSASGASLLGTSNKTPTSNTGFAQALSSTSSGLFGNASLSNSNTATKNVSPLFSSGQKTQAGNTTGATNATPPPMGSGLFSNLTFSDATIPSAHVAPKPSFAFGSSAARTLSSPPPNAATSDTGKTKTTDTT